MVLLFETDLYVRKEMDPARQKGASGAGSGRAGRLALSMDPPGGISKGGGFSHLPYFPQRRRLTVLVRCCAPVLAWRAVSLSALSKF